MSEQPDDSSSSGRRGAGWCDMYVDRHRVLNVIGELDVSTAPRFAVELDRLAEDGGNVCVDFSSLAFCAAAGINALVGAVNVIGDHGRIVIYDPSPMVTRLIGITGVESLLDVAVSRFAHRAPVGCSGQSRECPMTAMDTDDAPR